MAYDLSDRMEWMFFPAAFGAGLCSAEGLGRASGLRSFVIGLAPDLFRSGF